MATNPNYRITRVVTPATDMALVTLEEVKAALGIDPADTSSDVALTAQINAISAAINNYCNRIFPQQVYQDQGRQLSSWLNPGQPLRVRQPPIDTDTLVVTEDGVVLGADQYEVDAENGAIYRLQTNMIAAWGGNLVLFDYTGGFEPIPADVKAGALQWLNTRWMAKGRDPALRSETIPDVISVVYQNDSASSGSSYSDSRPPPEICFWLQSYRLWFL
jgi:hypothetical protein